MARYNFLDDYYRGTHAQGELNPIGTFDEKLLVMDVHCTNRLELEEPAEVSFTAAFRNGRVLGQFEMEQVHLAII